MAFIGLLLADIFLLLIFIGLVITLIFFIVGIILAIVGKVKNSRVPKILGTVFSIVSGVILLTAAVIIGIFYYNFSHSTVTMPSGEEVEYATYDVDKMIEYTKSRQNDKLRKLIEKKPELLYVPNDGMNLIDVAMLCKNTEAVQIALDNGLEFDEQSFRRYLGYIGERKIITNHVDYKDIESYMDTAIDEEDVAMAKFLLENGCPFGSSSDVDYDANLLYDVVWTVYWHEKVITDDCLDFVQVFIDYGFDKYVPTGHGNDLYSTTVARIEFYEDLYDDPSITARSGKVDEFMELLK